MTVISASDPVADEATKSIFRKIYIRIMPILFVSYLIAFIDRVNVGFVKLEMTTSIGMDPAQYGFAAGLFFITYALFEVPTNMIFERMGARKTFLRIMMLWGVTVVGTAFVTSPTQFYVMRMLLGLFEAGFFPGMILYLTYWYPSQQRARATATIMLANALASVIVGPLSGAIMEWAHSAGGLEGWQWVFILQGFPACIMGLVCFFMLSDRPATAKWLTADEKARLTRILEEDKLLDEQGDRLPLKAVLTDHKLYLLALIYFCPVCANYMFTFWLPTIIKESGVPSLLDIGLFTTIPMAVGCLGLIVVNLSSDYLAERRWHLAICYLIAAVGLALSPFASSLWTVLLSLAIANFGVTAVNSLFWSLPPTYFNGRRAPAGIAMISMLGISAGFFSPMILGVIKTQTNSLAIGLQGIGALLLMCCVLVIFAVPKQAVRVGQR